MRIKTPKFTRQGFQKLFSDPARVFLLIAAPLGIAMVFIMPPFMVPDEMVHFQRAYQVGEAGLVADVVGKEIGGYVPEMPVLDPQTPGLAPRVPTTELISERSKEVFEAFPSAALYSPLAYIPQAIGINLGRIVYPSLGVMLLFGRLFNLLAFIIMIYFSIRIANRGKWVYVAIALFPVAIQQAASLSTDVMTIGLSFLVIALVHSLFGQSKKLSNHQFIGLVTLALGLGLTKQTNIILLLPILFLPLSLFRDRIHKVKTLSIILFASIAGALFWYIIANYFYKSLNVAPSIGMDGVDPVGQLRYILSNPISYSVTLFRTFIFEGFRAIATGDFFIFSMHSIFSWLSYKLPLAFVLMGYILLLLSLLYGNKNEVNINQSRTIITETVTFVLSVAAIGTALYLVWTPVGQLQIAGIQGRYFIPLIPLLIPLFGLFQKWVRVEIGKTYYMGYLVAGISSLNLLAGLVVTYLWFY